MPSAPVTSVGFRDAVKDCGIFADKTMLIYELLHSDCRKVIITRPRRFGKTMALSMLDRFFDIRYRSEESDDDTFAGLEISKVPGYAGWASEGGLKNSYPVIMLNLARVTFTSGDSFSFNLRLHIRDMVKTQFRDLYRSESYDGEECRDYVGDLRNDAAEPGEILASFCNLLHRHYGVPPVILVDEYDCPVEHAFRNDYFEAVTERYSDFVNSGLKNNPDVYMVVMTGVQRIIARNIFSSLNDFKHYGVVSDRLGHYFGFTEDEVECMIKAKAADHHPDMSVEDLEAVVEDRMSVAREWYDGYSFGGMEIYNPWSIVNFIEDDMKGGIDDIDKPGLYWNDTAQNRILVSLLSVSGDDVLSAVKSFYVDNDTMDINDFSDHMVLIRPDQPLSTDDVFRLLVVSGYLTVSRTSSGYSLRIPNNEVRQNFNSLMSQVYCFSIPSVIRLLRHITSADAVSVKKDLEDLMSGGSYLDGWSEQRYRSWLHDIFALHGYSSITEREAGEGRIDLLVEAYKGMPAIVFEFKVVGPDSSEDLLEAASSGAAQIKDRRYADSKEMAGAVALSVAFRKKTCEVVFVG